MPPRRSRAREAVLQVLYREDLNPSQDPRSIERFVESRLRGDPELVAFAMSLAHGVLRNREELDQLLEARGQLEPGTHGGYRSQRPEAGRV